MRKHAKKGAIARDETFDEFLGSEGLLAETEELAIKELIAKADARLAAHLEELKNRSAKK